MTTAPRIAGMALLLSSVAVSIDADWLVHSDGQRTEVQGFELGERSVETVTLNGKPWSVVLDAIDVPATRAANRMRPEERLSPSWAQTPARDQPVDEVVTIEAEPELVLPEPAPPAAPPPRVRKAPPPPRVTRPPAPQPLPRPRPNPAATRPTRVAVFVKRVAAGDAAGLDFSESRTFERFNESGSLDTHYQETTQPGYELGALVRIGGAFGVMASAELLEPSPSASYHAVVPHPYFYDRPRELDGERTDLFRRELTVHVDPVLTFELGERLDVDLYSGVSLFFTETDVIDEILYDEVFPFDSLAASGARSRRIEDRPIGFNLGTSVTFRVVSFIGLDFGVRYSRGEARLLLADDRELTFDAGGLRMGAGLRLLFP